MNHSLEIAEDEPDSRLEQGSLTFGVEAKEDSEAGAYIKSWANATRGDSQLTNTINMEESAVDSANIIPELKFEVVYARTIESPKKHVAYTVMVRKDSVVPDPHPSVIERRYTEFLELYMALRQEHPSLLSTFAFPKKALIGNFTPEMISSRSAGFEAFLMLIAANEKLRNSAAVTDFLQHREYSEARHWIEEKRYDQAVPLLENSFLLLNKLHTDRHPSVLRTLCLLVACCEAGNDKQTERFAEIALRRYEAVSDADLLQYYVPLLQLCVHHYWSTELFVVDALAGSDLESLLVMVTVPLGTYWRFTHADGPGDLPLLWDLLVLHVLMALTKTENTLEHAPGFYGTALTTHKFKNYSRTNN